ncbi:MAG: hypothetical protein AzoDbin1_05315 [Azoarcus sp.]|nr:hypothetical protein [Azoarcus sp.]
MTAPNTSVQLFDFRSNQIRVVMIDGEPWFVAREVCLVLGSYVREDGSVNTSTALQPLGSGEKVVISYAEAKRIGLQAYASRAHGMSLTSESGLYKLVMRSDKPQAKPFQDWVTKDVLPAIRKDGAYVMGEEKVATGEMSEDELVIKAMSILQRKVERITKERDEALAVIWGERTSSKGKT